MKKFGLSLLVVVLILTGAGCGRDVAGGAVEITVVSPFDSDDGNHLNYVNAYRAYEEQTGNTVKDLSKSSSEEWKRGIISDFEQGNEADVLFFFTGADANSLVKNNKVVPLNEIRQYNSEYATNMKDSMTPVSPADGRQYAVPVNGYWEGLYVNKRVLADCGVEVPGTDYTWEQFVADCQVIRDKGYIPIACSLNEAPHYWFEFCAFNHGSIYTHATLPANAEDDTSATWATGFEDIKFLYDSGFFPPDTNTITNDEASLLMTGDQAAFMLEGSWKLGWFQEKASDLNNFTVTYAPSKGERQATDIVGGLSMGYYISQKAWADPQKREAAVAFVMAMTTDDVVNSFGALSVTALKNGTTPPAQTDPLVMSALNLTKGCTGIVEAVQDGLSRPARDALFANVKNIVTGKITPQQALEECLTLNLSQ